LDFYALLALILFLWAVAFSVKNTSKPRSVPRVFRIIFTKRIFSKNIPDRRIIKKSKFMHIYSPLCIFGEIAAKCCSMRWLLNFRNGAIKLSK
tara:strand:+ start:431 stop:709 length:279 start_codon:yes stop_codon:yes gene_type:complete